MIIMYAAFVFLGIAVALFIYNLKSSAIRKTSTYRMYAARDDLVCLVAEKRLSEESPIFQYYYQRANFLLKKAPKIGVDHAVEKLLKYDGNDIEHSLEEAKRKADEMLNLVQQEEEAVGQAITSYYEASRDMMLAHSSTIRLTYLVWIKGRRWELIGRVVAGKTMSMLKAAKFADEEAHQFRQATYVSA